MTGLSLALFAVLLAVVPASLLWRRRRARQHRRLHALNHPTWRRP